MLSQFSRAHIPPSIRTYPACAKSLFVPREVQKTANQKCKTRNTPSSQSARHHNFLVNIHYYLFTGRTSLLGRKRAPSRCPAPHAERTRLAGPASSKLSRQPYPCMRVGRREHIGNLVPWITVRNNQAASDRRRAEGKKHPHPTLTLSHSSSASSSRSKAAGGPPGPRVSALRNHVYLATILL